MNEVLPGLPADVLRALCAEPSALRGFGALPAGYRDAWIGHVADARSPATREARIERLVDAMAAEAQRVPRPA